MIRMITDLLTDVIWISRIEWNGNTFQYDQMKENMVDRNA